MNSEHLRLYGTREFLTMFTRDSHRTPTLSRTVPSTPAR